MQSAFPEDFRIERSRDLGAALSTFHANEGETADGGIPISAKEQDAVKPVEAGDAGP